MSRRGKRKNSNHLLQNGFHSEQTRNIDLLSKPRRSSLPLLPMRGNAGAREREREKERTQLIDRSTPDVERREGEEKEIGNPFSIIVRFTGRDREEQQPLRRVSWRRVAASILQCKTFQRGEG